MRVVFRIGGSVVASPVNTDLIGKYVEVLKSLKQDGYEVAVVVGGGSLAREFIDIARKLNLEMPAQDKVAISCSRLFAQLFAEKFGDFGCGKVAVTLDEAAACLAEGKIAVMGGLKPGITTDAVAALVAERIGADLLVKGTDQEGIYDKDPRRFKDAVKLDHLRFDDLKSVLAETEHKAGIHQIIDPEAVKVLSRRRVRLVVVNGFVPENFLLVVKSERVGTTVD
jgi:uridylate kinase